MMDTSASVWLVLLAVFSPVVAGLASMALPRAAVAGRVATALCGPMAAFFFLLAGSGRVDAPLTGTLAWLHSLNLNLAFLCDGLGLFFGLLVSGIGAMIVLYARGYFGKLGPTSEDDLRRFYPLLGFFMTAMMGLVLADYTLLTLLFWEATSISSFFLIGWDRYDKKAVKLAMQAFFTTGMGGMALLGGILMLGTGAEVWRWSELYEAAASGRVDMGSPLVVWSFGLMFIGAAAKSAQWPLHYWLPGAMAAPTPVSAFLHSATMVKAGVFLTGRMMPALGQGFGLGGVEVWAPVIVPFGAVTMLLGGILALHQHDLKRIFAYTTVSQLGLLMTMYGLGGLTYLHDGHHVFAIDFDLTQIANHAFYKAPLFITAGAIGHVASRQLPELFGAFRKHKAICLTMLLAGYALAAGPGTISFPAKELFLYAIVHAAEEHPWVWLVAVMTVMTAACNVAIFVRLLTTLLGHSRFGLKPDPHAHSHEHHDQPHEHGIMAAMIWVPGLLIVSLQYIGGICPRIWDWMFLPLESAANYASFTKYGVPDLYYAITHPSLALLLSLVGIGLGIPLGLSRWMRTSHADVHDRIYPAAYWLAVTGGGRLFRTFQTGNLKHYLIVVLGFFLLVFAFAALPDQGIWDGLELSAVLNYPLGLGLGVIVCLTAVGIPFFTSRVIRVLLLGACGFSVVGIYVVYQAPDLALTQLMFEIISVMLFVIVLRLLPREQLLRRTGFGITGRIVFAALIGLCFGLITFTAANHEPDHRVGSVLAQHSYGNYTYNEAGDKVPALETPLDTMRGGGGNNIVNVILVDFRGIDTYGEIAVLGLAAMGVWSLLPRRRRDRAEVVTASSAGKEVSA